MLSFINNQLVSLPVLLLRARNKLLCVWQDSSVTGLMLSPLIPLVDAIRHWRSLIIKPRSLPIFSIVVGNIRLGGVGKTPFVISLAQMLTEEGLRVGLVGKGYQAPMGNKKPIVAYQNYDYETLGDEMTLLGEKTSCPVAIGERRSHAAMALASDERFELDCVIFDDGLQSFEIQPDLKIGLINERVGNGFRLPAGPLRAPWSNFDALDLLVPVGAQRGFFKKNVNWVIHHHSKEKRVLNSFSKVTCLFGLGDPRLLEEFLRSQSFSFKIEYLPDHGRCSPKDLRYYLGLGDVFMTEKDWVKYRQHVSENDALWIVPLEGVIHERVKERIFELIQRKGLCSGG